MTTGSTHRTAQGTSQENSVSLDDLDVEDEISDDDAARMFGTLNANVSERTKMAAEPPTPRSLAAAADLLKRLGWTSDVKDKKHVRAQLDQAFAFLSTDKYWSSRTDSVEELCKLFSKVSAATQAERTKERIA